MAAQCASYISLGRSYFLINGLLFYHLAPELSRRAALAIRNVLVAQRNIPFHSVPFHVESWHVPWHGIAFRSPDKIRFSFGRPATVSLQFFSFLFVVASFFLFFFFFGFCCRWFFSQANVFVFLLCSPKNVLFLLFHFFGGLFCFMQRSAKKYYFRYFVIASACSSCSHTHTHRFHLGIQQGNSSSCCTLPHLRLLLQFQLHFHF